jgi:hypothetical protein
VIYYREVFITMVEFSVLHVFEEVCSIPTKKKEVVKEFYNVCINVPVIVQSVAYTRSAKSSTLVEFYGRKFARCVCGVHVSLRNLSFGQVAKSSLL